MPTPAVIYCRVSSKKQLLGGGLESQEQSCRQYALSKGYKVVEVFKEKGLMGAVSQRPALAELITFLTAQKRETVIIIDDLKRFARDVQVHFSLKAAVIGAGGRFESPSFRFEETPEGKFVETLVAASAELERNQNARQTRNRMQARLELGLWAFHAPPGYRFIRHEIHKRLLSPNEQAGTVRGALEGYANASLSRIMDVVRFLDSRSYFPRRMAIKDRIEHVHGMLRNPLYVGEIEYIPWNVGRRPGYHKPLIDKATFANIQRRLAERTRPAMRIADRPEFVLKLCVACDHCGTLYTGSWSTGRSERYAYYHCRLPRCALRGKTIAVGDLEDDFRDLLRPLSATEWSLRLFRAGVLHHHDLALKEAARDRESMPSRLQAIERELRQQKAKLVIVKSDIGAATIDAAISELQQQYESLSQQASKPFGEIDVGTALEYTERLLKNPLQTWEGKDEEMRRILPSLVFEHPLRYQRNQGFGTADLTPPFLVSEGLKQSKSGLVHLEPERWNRLIEWIINNEPLLSRLACTS